MNLKSRELRLTIKTFGLCLLPVLPTVFIQMKNISDLNRLRFVFNDNYPIEAPEVIFYGSVPSHRHVYSNGFICMSILYDGELTRLECSDECRIHMLNTDLNALFRNS